MAEHDETPAATFQYTSWTFGDSTGPKWEREPQGKGMVRRSVRWFDVQNLMVYDVPLNVTENCLPPANVILSSNLAYRVLRLATTTGCILLSQLHRYWPANFLSNGAPCTWIEPLGRPAIVWRAGRQEFATYNGYIYAGSFGVQQMTLAADGSLRAVRASRDWFRSNQSSAGIGSTPDFHPEEFDLQDPNHLGTADPERMDPDEKWPEPLLRKCQEFSNGGLSFTPNNPSPTHPDKQSYNTTVRNNVASRRSGRVNPYVPGPVYDPLSSIPSIHSADPVPGKNRNVKTPKNPMDVPSATSTATNEILGLKEIPALALASYSIAVAGNLEIFPTHASLLAWVTAYGAVAQKDISAATTHLIIGDVGRRNTLFKDATEARNNGGNIKILTEKQFLQKIARAIPQASDELDTLKIPSDERQVVLLSGSPYSANGKLAAKADKEMTAVGAAEQANFRILSQHVSQLVHNAEIVRTTVFEEIEQNHRQQQVDVANLALALQQLPDSAAKDEAVSLFNSTSERIVAARSFTSDQFAAVDRNNETIIHNLLAANNARTTENFTSEMMDRAVLAGGMLPGDKIVPLTEPAAWHRDAPEAGTEADIANGVTIRRDYQTPENATRGQKRSFESSFLRRIRQRTGEKEYED